eukprot:gene9261-19222_t
MSSSESFVFKKRSVKGNNRRKVDSPVDNIENIDDDVDSLKLIQDLKAEQSFRKRQRNVDADDGKKTELKNKSIKIDNTIGNSMGTQFAVQSQGKYEGPAAHETIMNQYVEEKLNDLLGTVKEIEVKPLTEEEKLYRIPDEIKALEGKSKSALPGYSSKEQDGTMTTWSTGLAEVQLPIDFKLKNIQDTEAARKRQEDERSKKKKTGEKNKVNSTLCLGSASMIFQQTIDKPRNYPATATTTPSGTGEGSTQQTETQIKRPWIQRSTDDLALDRFKKRDMNFHRIR